MSAIKPIRTKGKLSFTRYFQTFENGDSIGLIMEGGKKAPFPERMLGRTGKVIGKRGAAYVVEVSDLGKKKQFMCPPLFLKKIKETRA